MESVSKETEPGCALDSTGLSHFLRRTGVHFGGKCFTRRLGARGSRWEPWPPMSTYDAVAPVVDRHRALPEGVPRAIRTAVLAAIGAPARPRLIDIGAGTGRIGFAFAAAGDDYVGVDSSFGMLRAFLERPEVAGGQPLLVQSDGGLLPFRDAIFDAAMLIQIFGGLRGWRRVVAEARRVLRPTGALVLGRTAAPVDGVDARMKQRLASILED